jgi:hypothetical protein
VACGIECHRDLAAVRVRPGFPCDAMTRICLPTIRSRNVRSEVPLADDVERTETAAGWNGADGATNPATHAVYRSATAGLMGVSALLRLRLQQRRRAMRILNLDRQETQARFEVT